MPEQTESVISHMDINLQIGCLLLTVIIILIILVIFQICVNII